MRTKKEKLQNKKTRTLCVFAAVAGLAALVTGCSPTQSLTSNAGTGSTVPGATTTSTTSDFVPNYTASFSIVGEQSVLIPSVSPSPIPGCSNCGGIQTDTIFQVQVTSGPAGQLSMPDGNGNFSATYGCVSYDVTVFGDTQSTGMLSVSGSDNTNCPSSPTSIVLDFSSRMSPGHGDIFMTVGQDEYDFYCQLWENPYYQYLMGGTYSMYCPLHTVFYNSQTKTGHTLTGTLELMTNGNTLN